MSRKFSKEERSSFPYWWAHYYTFNKTAWKLGHWKFKYLFHDIEKPWLKLLWGDYHKVQQWHRKHNSHHIEYYKLHGKADWEGMVIDWEASQYTKLAQPFNAREYLKIICALEDYKDIASKIKENVIPAMDRLGL